MKTVDFSETKAASDLKVSRSRHLFFVVSSTSTLFDSDLGHRPMTQNNTIQFTNKHAHAKYINY